MRSFVILFLLTLSPLARAQATYAVDTSLSKLTYHLVHKLHKVEGITHKVDGKAMLAPDGRAQVIVRVPVESFDSGNVNRDAHMKEAVDAARFPFVELKALAEGLIAPAAFPATVKKNFKAQLSFHGETKVFEIPVEIAWEAPDRVRGTTTFNISLEAFKVQRPSLMMVKVDDALVMDADLRFHKDSGTFSPASRQ
jgi:polyisoprenoid-binding protein YceI